MQSKNKTSDEINYSEYHNLGVVFTALVLSLVQIKIVFWSSDLGQIKNVFPILIFFGVVFLYSLDHYWDSLRTKVTQTTRILHQRINFGLILTSSMFGFLFFIFNFYLIMETLWWIPVGLVILYACALVFKIGFRGLKELLICSAITSALFLPIYNTTSICKLWPNMALLFIVCMQNLIVFAFFEKPKDDYFNNKTILSGLTYAQVKIIVWSLLGFLLAAELFIQFSYQSKFKCAWIIGFLYILIIALSHLFKKNARYRSIADGLLLFLLF